MKRIFLILVLLTGSLFFALGFAAHAGAGADGPAMMAGKGEAVLLAKIDTPCAEECLAQRDTCKNACTRKNVDCQEDCHQNEDCIYGCGNSYGKCADECVPTYEMCLQKCPRVYDGRIN